MVFNLKYKYRTRYKSIYIYIYTTRIDRHISAFYPIRDKNKFLQYIFNAIIQYFLDSIPAFPMKNLNIIG